VRAKTGGGAQQPDNMGVGRVEEEEEEEEEEDEGICGEGIFGRDGWSGRTGRERKGKESDVRENYVHYFPTAVALVCLFLCHSFGSVVIIGDGGWFVFLPEDRSSPRYAEYPLSCD